MASEPIRRHRLTLASGRAASGEASAWARALAHAAGLDEDRVYALDLCVVELVSNIVDHGYRGAAGEIAVELEVTAASALLVVVDRAPAFDPLSVPAPVMATSLEEATIGGLGIRMVRSAAGHCHYERRGGENVFTARIGKN